MAIFKYFTEEAHARAFINKGALLLRPLSYFRTLEDGGARGDRRDGILTYVPRGELAMNMEDGRVIPLEGWSFNASVQQDNIFVFCASKQRSSELAERFGSFCVEITEPDLIIGRLKQRARPGSQFDYEQIFSGSVDYRARDKEPGIDWAQPAKLVLIKPEGFAWQDEFRIAVGKRGTFDVENVGLTLQKGQAAAAAAPAQNHIILKIGNLSELTTLHRF